MGLVNQGKFKEMEAKYFDMEMAHLEEVVGGVYLEKMADPELVRVLLALQNPERGERRLITESMKQINAVHKSSQAPAGYMERQTQACIERMEAK